MEEYILLQEMQQQNENSKRALIRFRRHLRDGNNAFDLPENEFRNIYRYINYNEVLHFIHIL